MVRWQAPSPPAGGLGSVGDYVVGFVQYVRWPAEDDIRSWQVCIAAPLADKADAYAGRTARGKPFEVRAVGARDAIADLDVYIQRHPGSSVAYTKRGVRNIWRNDLAAAEGMVTLRQSALQKAYEGIISIEEALRLTE